MPGLTDGKEGIGRWTEGSKPGIGYLGLRPIKGVKSGLMRGGRLFMGNPKRVRSWKQRIQSRVGLKVVEAVLYSTLALIQTKIIEKPNKKVLEAFSLENGKYQAPHFYDDHREKSIGHLLPM